MSRRKPKLVRTLDDLRKTLGRWRRKGEEITLVPTMGALHDGHLTLVKRGRKRADRTVVSIFVNPTQFAPGEDLARYPRDEEGDLEQLKAAGADLVWAPTAETLYPEGFATRIVPAGAALGLEGQHRPQHFSGVATVCLKLFAAVAPEIAVFGEKDYQQLAVLRQMVRDLNLGLKIVAVPTVRETDGLALSSRNAYLSAAEREIAPTLQAELARAARRVRDGDDVDAASKEARHGLERAGFTKVDYVEVRDADTLAPYDEKAGRPGRVLGAAWLGTTRLIDNAPV